MPKPVIFTIDDDASVLNSVERDLRAHYGQEYRVLPIDSAKTALEYLKKLQQRNEAVALFLVDQRMPEMSGVEFLEEAIRAYPRAKRVLLTAYADSAWMRRSKAAIPRACARLRSPKRASWWTISANA